MFWDELKQKLRGTGLDVYDDSISFRHKAPALLTPSGTSLRDRVRLFFGMKKKVKVIGILPHEDAEGRSVYVSDGRKTFLVEASRLDIPKKDMQTLLETFPEDITYACVNRIIQGKDCRPTIYRTATEGHPDLARTTGFTPEKFYAPPLWKRLRELTREYISKHSQLLFIQSQFGHPARFVRIRTRDASAGDDAPWKDRILKDYFQDIVRTKVGTFKELEKLAHVMKAIIQDSAKGNLRFTPGRLLDEGSEVEVIMTPSGKALSVLENAKERLDAIQEGMQMNKETLTTTYRNYGESELAGKIDRHYLEPLKENYSDFLEMGILASFAIHYTGDAEGLARMIEYRLDNNEEDGCECSVTLGRQVVDYLKGETPEADFIKEAYRFVKSIQEIPMEGLPDPRKAGLMTLLADNPEKADEITSQLELSGRYEGPVVMNGVQFIVALDPEHPGGIIRTPFQMVLEQLNEEKFPAGVESDGIDHERECLFANGKPHVVDMKAIEKLAMGEGVWLERLDNASQKDHIAYDYIVYDPVSKDIKTSQPGADALKATLKEKEGGERKETQNQENKPTQHRRTAR